MSIFVSIVCSLLFYLLFINGDSLCIGKHQRTKSCLLQLFLLLLFLLASYFSMKG